MKRLTCCVLLLAATGAALAQDGTAAEPRTWFQLQALAPRIDTKLRIDDVFFGSSDGTDIDGESDLGLPERRAAAGFTFGRRIGENWRFELDYLRSRRSSSTVLARDLVVGGLDYAAGDRVGSHLRLQLLRLNAGLSLVHDARNEVGIAFGGVLSRFHLALRDEAMADETFHWSSHDAMPLLGVYFSTALAPTWRLAGRVEGARRHGASAKRAEIEVRWQATPLFGLAAGVRWAAGRVVGNVDLFDFDNQRLEYRMAGPQVGASLTF